jgi:hypothetical protein
MARVSLTITAAPVASDVGRRFDVDPGSWRVLGRALSQQDATVPLTRDGDRALDADRQDLVDRRLGSPARVRTGSRRGPDVDLQDGKCSRTHAMVFVDAHGGVSVVDLMSTNGTTVNGEPIQDADLSAGDVVGVGQTRLIVG